MSRKMKIERQKKKEKWKLLRYADDIFESNALFAPHIEIFGNSNINIDGCVGVYEYNDTYIKLKLAKGALILCGNGFEISLFEHRMITVKGKISSLEFCV